MSYVLTISSCLKYLLNICDSYIQGVTNNGRVAAVNQTDAIIFLPRLHQMLTNFQSSLTLIFCIKFVMKQSFTNDLTYLHLTDGGQFLQQPLLLTYDARRVL